MRTVPFRKRCRFPCDAPGVASCCIARVGGYTAGMPAFQSSPGESSSFRFRARPNVSPLASLNTSPITGSAERSPESSVARGGDYATSFNPELYRELRRYVQAEGWNTLLDGVTFRSGDLIVDLGFGDGGNTALLAQDLRESGADCRVFGIEKSGEMVLSARRAFPQDQNPNLTLLEGAAERAGEILDQHLGRQEDKAARDRVTHVISNYTLHWVRDPSVPTRFLHEEMLRSLNPLQPIGGTQRHFCAHQDAFKELFEAGYVVIRNNPAWRSFFQASGTDYSEDGEWRHPPLVTQEGILRALDAAGYSGTAELHTDQRAFPNVEVLKDWVQVMIRPFMSRIPAHAQRIFVDDWIAQYLAITGQASGGSVVLTDRNLLIAATKERCCQPESLPCTGGTAWSPVV